MAEYSEHFLDCFTTIVAVNAQLLQSILVIISGNANLPSASDADKRYRVTTHQAPLTGCKD